MGCCGSKYDDYKVLDTDGNSVNASSVNASYADFLCLKKIANWVLGLVVLTTVIAIVLLVLASINTARIDDIKHRTTQNYIVTVQDKILGSFACRPLLDSIAASDGFAAAAEMAAQIKGMPAAQWPGYCVSQYDAIGN